jgi:hypothetical protein
MVTRIGKDARPPTSFGASKTWSTVDFAQAMDSEIYRGSFGFG